MGYFSVLLDGRVLLQQVFDFVPVDAADPFIIHIVAIQHQELVLLVANFNLTDPSFAELHFLCQFELIFIVFRVSLVDQEDSGHGPYE